MWRAARRRRINGECKIYLLIILLMSLSTRVLYREVREGEKPRIEIVANRDLQVSYCYKTKGISKYKKVSKIKKEQLLEYIFVSGRSIIESSKILQINYSTAKSIVLNYKKRKVNQSEMETNSDNPAQKPLPHPPQDILIEN